MEALNKGRQYEGGEDTEYSAMCKVGNEASATRHIKYT